MIDLGFENELLEYGGPDLVPFLQTAGRVPLREVRSVSGQMGVPILSNQARYFDLLAKYYVLKRQHLLASHVLLRLAERRSTEGEDVPSLEQRHQYLSNAVLQAKNASNSDSLAGSNRNSFDSGLLDLLEGKLVVLRFQMKIKEELDAMASRLEASPGTSESVQNEPFPDSGLVFDANFASTLREKAKELSLDLKSITQLYNDYGVPFELWEICLEILYFASYSGDADSSIIRETWARLMDQALLKGGIGEACAVLKRVFELRKLLPMSAPYDFNIHHELHKRMRPWILKKITEFLGEEENTLVDYILSSTQEHVKASQMLELLQSILDDEAEMFVLKMWRMLIFEINKVEASISSKSKT